MSLVDDARRLPREQRVAGGAALALCVAMLLPWYQETHFHNGRYVHDALNAFQVFTWVEAAVLLVAAGVLFLLWARAEKRGFHLPGGVVVMVAGGWTVLLLAWRLFDKPSLAGDVGIDWGIFAALLAAGTLTWAGGRMRSARRPEPPLPAAVERAPDRRRHTAPTEPLGPRRTSTAPTRPLPDEQLAIDDPPAFEPPRGSR